MKLATILSPANDLRFAISHALIPTLKAIFQNPLILLHPKRLSQLFFNHVWTLFGDHIDAGGKESKLELIKDVKGVVFDIGAGHGHTLEYLESAQVDTYIALEPNALMHPYIRTRAEKLGYSEATKPSKESNGRFIILSQGAEDIAGIKAALLQYNISKVDTIISILTFCSIPFPDTTLPALAKSLLKPGGQFLFYEHVLSPRSDVAYWQRVWSPFWSKCFDGCRLDVPTHSIVEAVTADDGSEFWKEKRAWSKAGEPEEHLFWHRTGSYTRA